MTDENLFNTAEPTAAIDQLVGDGKKFKTIEDLAKAKLESDAFILRLQQEQAALREDLNARVRMEQLLERLEQAPDEGTTRNEINQTQSNSPTDSPDIAKLIEQTLTKREAEQKVAANRSEVEAALRKYFGDDYQSKARARAAKLNLDESILNELASKAPKEFLKLMEMNETRQDSMFTPPTSKTFVPSSTSSGGLKTFKDYEALRKADPTTYWKPEVQLTLHRLAKEAAEKGEDFYR